VTMKAAFSAWNKRVAPVFDVARRVSVIEADSGRIVSETDEKLASQLPVERALRLADLGVDTLVCGAISRPLRDLIAAKGIRVIPFVSGDLAEVINAWISGRLETRSFTMPGCCGRGRRFGARLLRRREMLMFGSGDDGTGPGAGPRIEGAGQGGPGGGRGGGRGAGRGAGRGGRGAGRGAGRGGPRPGRMAGPLAAGPGGVCACAGCGYEEPHQPGVPCVQRICPKCGSNLVRK